MSTEKPAIIVLDVRMPTVAGDTLANTLGKFYDLPIVFYSAISDDEGAALERKHSRSVFVSKAGGLRDLYQAVVAALKDGALRAGDEESC